MATGKGGRPQQMDSIYKMRPNKRPKQRTMLAEWLKAHGLSRDGFAKMVGCNGKMVDYWCDGQVIPNLMYAFMIEKVSEGSISAEMWLGTQLGRYQWNEMQERARTERGWHDEKTTSE